MWESFLTILCWRFLLPMCALFGFLICAEHSLFFCACGSSTLSSLSPFSMQVSLRNLFVAMGGSRASCPILFRQVPWLVYNVNKRKNPTSVWVFQEQIQKNVNSVHLRSAWEAATDFIARYSRAATISEAGIGSDSIPSIFNYIQHTCEICVILCSCLVGRDILWQFHTRSASLTSSI